MFFLCLNLFIFFSPFIEISLFFLISFTSLLTVSSVECIRPLAISQMPPQWDLTVKVEEGTP